MKVNLNLSTAPLENHRRFVTGAGLLGLAALIALALLASKSYSTWSANRTVRADNSHIADQIQALEQQQQQYAQYFDTPEAKQVLDRSAFLNSLIEARTFPWPKIFEDLEQILPGGVRVVTIAPRLQGGRALVKLTVAATDDDSVVEFLRALEASKVFSDVHVEEEKYVEEHEGRGAGASSDRITVTLEASYSTS